MTRDFSELTSTAAVLERNVNCRDDRLREIMSRSSPICTR
jgi:hypothetical protein